MWIKLRKTEMKYIFIYSVILIISTHLTTVASTIEPPKNPTISSNQNQNKTIELLQEFSTRIGKRELQAQPLPTPAQLKLRRRPAQKRTKPTFRRRRRPSAKQHSQPKPVYGPPSYNYGDTLANYPGPNEIGYSYNTNNNNFQQQTKFYNTLNPNFTYTPPYIPPSGDSYANYGSRQPQTYQQEFEPSAPSYPNSGQSFAEPPRPTQQQQQQNIGYSYPTNSYNPQQQLNSYQTLPKQYKNQFVPPVPQNNIQQSGNPYRNVIPTPSLALEYESNGKNSYDTPITSYDVPLNYDESRTKNYRSQTTEGYQQPPELPNTYDQNSFNLFAKDKYNRAIVQNTQPIDFIPEINYFDGNYGSGRKKTPAPTNLNAFANLDDDLPDDEYIDEIITTTIAPTRRRRYRKRRPSTSPPHNLDTDDLRDSYNSGSKLHNVVVRPDFQKISKPMTNKGTTNFVLNSAGNNFKPTESTVYGRNNFDIISIQQSKSHSYYAGTMASDIDSSQMNVVSSGIYVGSEQDTGKNSGTVRNGYVVKDNNFADRNDVFFDRYNAADFKSTRHKEKSIRSVESTTIAAPLVWDGKNLPKNHKITSRDRTV